VQKKRERKDKMWRRAVRCENCLQFNDHHGVLIFHQRSRHFIASVVLSCLLVRCSSYPMLLTVTAGLGRCHKSSLITTCHRHHHVRTCVSESRTFGHGQWNRVTHTHSLKSIREGHKVHGCKVIIKMIIDCVHPRGHRRRRRHVLGGN
jgi:hypothetical protein